MMMFERFALQFVDKYLSPYAEVDPEEVCAGIRRGQVVLRNVKLKTSAFAALGLPLTVYGGKIGELQMRMNMRCLRAAPASIVLRDVDVVIGPAGTMASGSVRSERRKQAVADTLREDEELRRIRVHGVDAMQLREESFFHKLFSSSIDSLGVQLENLHVRYEDNSSDPEKPFAAGITLESLAINTADAKSWRFCEWQANSELVNKLLSLKNLAVYWQPGTSPYSPRKAVDGSQGGPYFVLSPLSGEARICVNRGKPTADKPRLGIDVNIPEAQYNLDCMTLRDFASLLDAGVKYSNRELVAMDRPAVAYSGSARVWWRYILDCVCDEVRSKRASSRTSQVSASIRRATKYVPLFKRRLAASKDDWHRGLSESEQEDIRALEVEMPIHMVIALRGRAEEMLVQEQTVERNIAEQQHRSLFCRLFSGWMPGREGKHQVQVAGLTMSVSEEELCEFIGEEAETSFHDFEGDPAESARYRFKFSMGSLQVSLSDREGTTGNSIQSNALVKLIFGAIMCDVSRCRGPALTFAADASFSSVDVLDMIDPDSAYMSVVKGGDKGRPLLRIRAEEAPTDGHASYVLRVETAPCTLVHSYALAARMGRFLGFWRRVDTVALTSLISRSAAQSMDQQRAASQRFMREVLDIRKPVDFQLDLHAPDIVIPSGHTASKEESLIVLRLGCVSTKSLVADMPTAAPGSVDRCEVVWKGVQIIACGAQDEWRSSKAEAFISVPHVSTILDIASERGNINMTQATVKQVVQDISASVTSDAMHHIASVLLSLNARKANVEKDVQLDIQHLSAMVRLSVSFVRTVEQTWDYMKRREMATIHSLEGDKFSRLKAYASWERLRYIMSLQSASFILTDTRGGKRRNVIRACVRGIDARVSVRSLDAEATGIVAGFEVEDLGEPFGPDYKYLVRTNEPCIAGPFVTGKIHVWHRTSPDYAGMDADGCIEVGHVSIGSNLETLADLQNVLVASIERAVQMRTVASGAIESEDVERENRLILAYNVESAVSVLQTVKTSPVSTVFRFATHGFDVVMYTGRGGSVYPLSSVEVGDCVMTYKVTKRGRIEVDGRVGDLIVRDLTPAGIKYGKVLCKAESCDLPLRFEYVHFGRGEGDGVLNGSLKACIGKFECIVSPRFVTEMYYYVSESSVYRANLMALRQAAAGAAKIRQRVDTSVLSHQYIMSMLLSIGGLFVKMPAGSADDDNTVLTIPAVEVKNSYDLANARFAVEHIVTIFENVRVATIICGVEQELLAVSMRLEMHRQVAPAGLGPEVPVLKISWSVGIVDVTLAQQQVSLAWRTVMVNLREARASMSWGGERKARCKDRSLLDIEFISKGLQSAVEEASLVNQRKLAAGPRADQQLLDVLFEATVEKVHVTLLGGKGEKLIVLGSSGMSSGLWIYSDTSYRAEVRIFSVSLDDINALSETKHRALIRSADEFAELASCVYNEDRDGNGKAVIAFTGIRVVLSADPISNVASQLLDAFSTSTGGLEDNLAALDDCLVLVQELAPGAFSWWGDSKVEGRMTVGQCMLTVLQDCTVEDTPSITLVFCAAADYKAAKLEEHVALSLHDVEIYATTPEIKEPLHILDRSSAAMHVSRLYESGHALMDINVSCRSLDFVVTYQDVKLAYGIMRSFQRSGDKSGMMQTAGARQLEAFLGEEELHGKRSILPRDGVGPITSTKMHLQCDVLTVCLINDCMGWTVPFATASAKQISLAAEFMQDLSSSVSASATFDVNFYNIVNTCFEPVMEPWTVKLDVTEEAWRRSSTGKVHSASRLDINMCEMHMRALVQTMESWMQDSKSWGTEYNKEASKFWPYRLRNEAGAPLTFWLGSSLDPPGQQSGDQVVRELDSGGEQPFQFSHKRALQARQRDMSLEFHTLSIKFQGVQDILTHVPVDITGVHMLPLGELRAVAEIHLDSGTKIVAIQSTFKVYNKSSSPVETSIYNEDDSLESLWADSFAGDMHGCVPLNLVGCKYMRLRPATNAGRYNYSNAIPVPMEPVTGESVFVACQPIPGADEVPVYFRVRLDAKKPIGGHEERMRVVISIHPALRVQNLLPFTMQVGVYSVSHGRQSDLIASVMPAEGAIEQLHCSELKTPLHMNAFLPHFRKVKEPALVYHPDPSVTTAKTLEVHDEQGLPLHLGIDTTTSAWGDLTVIFYAQYLVLNFSCLPMLYGVHKVGRPVRPCAGQAPTASPESSPAKTTQTQASDDYHPDLASSTVHGIYAVFGPRSSFQGKLVACKPPMADAEIVNGAELQGNIAIIKRGIVPFTVKARRAAAAGAIGVVFINSDDSTFLAEGDSGPGIRIPCIMLTRSDGQILEGEGARNFKLSITPESRTTRQRASSLQLEWKRVVQATVHSYGGSIAAASPERSTPKKEIQSNKDKDIDFPDSWMEMPGDVPFMLSYDSHDLTGNRAALCVRGSEWSEPFSMESVGTTGVLQAKGQPSDHPSLKKARPLYELGLSFQLGTGTFSRSKVVSIVPRYTVVNRTGFTLQLSQVGLEGDANAHLELPDGDLQPYHWIDEKRAKSCTARVVPRIGTQETFHTGWCGSLNLEQIGTFAVLFPAESAQSEKLHVSVTVKLRKAAAFIIFRNADLEHPMYAVDNKSSKPVMVWQEGGNPKVNGSMVLPGRRVPFSWDRPHDSRVLMLCVEGGRDVQNVKMEKFSKFKCKGMLIAEVLADGCTRALRITDEGKSDDSSSVADSEVGDFATSTLTLEFAGAGVSLVDSKLEEILLAAVLDVKASFRTTRTDHEFELKVGRMQVDNQTDDGPEIVLAPDPEKGVERPTLHLSIVKSRLHKHMGYFKYFAVGVREMVLDLEETFVMRLLDTAQNVVDASTISPPEEKSENLRNSGFKKLRFLSKEAALVDKIYIELLQLHPILVSLSFYGTGAILQRASSEGGGLSYNPMFAAMKALGVVVTCIDKAPIALNALMLERPFATQHELVSSVRKHYKMQLVHQLYKLIGSFEFLGNPVGLVNNLGTGVHDFFYEPAQGITKSPAEFAKGMSKGSLSLWRNSVYGVFNAASKITGSMSKGLVHLTGDEDYIKKRQEAQAARHKTAGSMAGHRQDFANEVSDGFAGIFAKPMAGFTEGGASGFLSGLGKGLLGAVVKPTAGLMDLTSKSAQAACDTAKAGKKTDRIRPPRVNLGDGVLRNYDVRSAHGCDAMRRLREGAWKDHRYIGYCVLEKGQAVVVTDRYVCAHDSAGLVESWTCEIKELLEVKVLDKKVSLTAEAARGRHACLDLECSDERTAGYMEEAIRRAMSLNQADAGRRHGIISGRNSEYML